MVSVERLISEIRSGRPVLIRDKNQLLLAASIEILGEELARRLDLLADGQASLLLPAARLRRLGLEREASGRVALPKVDLNRIEMLALRLDARIDAPVMAVSAIERAALDL